MKLKLLYIKMYVTISILNLSNKLYWLSFVFCHGGLAFEFTLKC